MKKAKSCAFLLTLILALALLIMPFGALSVSAAESTDTQVTATTSASVKQGNSGYCYVYIDSLESISTLSVTVHYDSDKVSVQSGYVYNSVSSLLNDKSVSESSVQFSYIFRFGAFGSALDLNAVGLNHRPEVVGGVLGDECRGMLTDYFRKKRKKSDNN